VDISKPYDGRRDARSSHRTDSSYALPGIRQRYQNTLYAAADEQGLGENPATTGHPHAAAVRGGQGQADRTADSRYRPSISGYELDYGDSAWCCQRTLAGTFLPLTLPRQFPIRRSNHRPSPRNVPVRTASGFPIVDLSDSEVVPMPCLNGCSR
jgi:hypothetical protein